MTESCQSCADNIHHQIISDPHPHYGSHGQTGDTGGGKLRQNYNTKHTNFINTTVGWTGHTLRKNCNVLDSECEEISFLQRETECEEPLQPGAGCRCHVGEGRGGRQQSWRYFSWRPGGGSRHSGQSRQPRDSVFPSGELSPPPHSHVDIGHQLRPLCQHPGRRCLLQPKHG